MVSDFAENNELSEVLSVIQENRDNGDPLSMISQLEAIGEDGNLCAKYHLGLCYLLGQMPRFYNFDIAYPPKTVKLSAKFDINERLGLHNLLQLLDLEDEKIEQYQLQGLYDLYRILDGRAVFFKDNDIECRVVDGEESDLSPLFENSNMIKDILKDLDYYEIYIDLAQEALIVFNNDNSNKDAILEAVKYLNSIIEAKDNYFDFNVHKKALFLLGSILLNGNEHVQKNSKQALSLLEKSHLDEAYLVIINYLDEKLSSSNTEAQIKKINAKIFRAVNLITDPELKSKFQEKYAMPNDSLGVQADLANAVMRMKTTAVPLFEKILPVDNQSVPTTDDVEEKTLPVDNQSVPTTDDVEEKTLPVDNQSVPTTDDVEEKPFFNLTSTFSNDEEQNSDDFIEQDNDDDLILGGDFDSFD